MFELHLNNKALKKLLVICKILCMIAFGCMRKVPFHDRSNIAIPFRHLRFPFEIAFYCFLFTDVTEY